MARRPATRTSGFTLFEALITLAVIGLVLGLILTLAERTRATGYRLALRAVDSADRRLREEDLRATLAAFVLPPLTIPIGTQTSATQDDSFEGEATSIAGWFTSVRPGLCGRAGRTVRVTLTLTHTAPGRTTLTCEADPDPPRKMELPLDNARFTYSDDGMSWQDSWTVEHGQTVSTSQTPNAELRKVFIRLAGQARPGQPSGAIIERAADQRPANAPNPNAASIP